MPCDAYDSESEDEEADIAPRPTVGLITSRVCNRDSRGTYLRPRPWSNVVERLKISCAERKARSALVNWSWNMRFYWEMVLKGAVPKPPSDDEDDGRPRKKSKKSDRDDGPSEPRGPPRSCRQNLWAGSVERRMLEPGGAGAGGAGAVVMETVVLERARWRWCNGVELVVPNSGSEGYWVLLTLTFMMCNHTLLKALKVAVGFCQLFEKLELCFRISGLTREKGIRCGNLAIPPLTCRASDFGGMEELLPWVIDADNGTPLG
ncbi:hypothetical protein Tco_1351190 [Tanacetum coccineum]